jgi:hypothetical protein
MAHAAGTNGDDGPGVSRRSLLIGGVAVALAAGGGVAVGALQHVDSGKAGIPPPADLVAALAAERDLIASIDATTGGVASVRAALRVIRADHAAHQEALEAALAGYRRAPSDAASTARATALDVAGLIAAEQQASQHTSTRATALTGREATLLASIAACEATHAELLG